MTQPCWALGTLVRIFLSLRRNDLDAALFDLSESFSVFHRNGKVSSTCRCDSAGSADFEIQFAGRIRLEERAAQSIIA